jgi:hypothetical protein
MAMGTGCNGPKIKNVGDEPIKVTEMDGFDVPTDSVKVLAPGDEIPADIGLLKIEAQLSPGRSLARWAGNFKPAASHTRTEHVLWIDHKFPCTVDAVDVATVTHPPIDVVPPGAPKPHGLNFYMTDAQIAKFVKWVDTLPA